MKQVIVLLVVLSVIGVAFSTWGGHNKGGYRQCRDTGSCGSSECCVYSRRSDQYGGCRRFGRENDDCLVEYGSWKNDRGSRYYEYSPCQSGLTCRSRRSGDRMGRCQRSY